MNPIISQMNAGKINPQQVKQMWNNLKTISNPQQAIQQALQNNPQLQQLMQMCNNDPKQAFYNLAQQKGIDPDYILNMLK